MKNLAALLLLHVWFLGFLYLCLATIWGKFARATYQARTRWSSILLPGQLKNPVVWQRRQKITACIALPVVMAIYLVMLVSLLR